MSAITCLVLSGGVLLDCPSELHLPEQHYSQIKLTKLDTTLREESLGSTNRGSLSALKSTRSILAQTQEEIREQEERIFPRSPNILPRELPEAKPNPLPSTPIPIPQSIPLLPTAETITIERFEFLENTAFTTKELQQATQHLLGKPLSFPELLEVEKIITQLYIESGYVNSGAYIPTGQTFSLDRAIVQIQVVEGFLESVEITGTDALKKKYISDRLPSTREKPLNQKKLLRDLQLLQLNPLIESISAQLAAGARPEASSLTIEIAEAETFNINAFIDNGRSPSVGSFRRGIRLEENNFLGFGDRLNLSYTNTDGSNTGNLSYNFPLNSQNGSVSFAAGINDTKIVESPFESLNILGDSYNLDLSFRQPLIFEPTQEFTLGVTFSYQDSQTKLPLNNKRENSISAIRFFQEFTQRNPTELFALRSQFSVGLDIFDSTTDNNAADSRFVSWRGQTQYVKLLAPETLLVLRGDVQISDDSLLSQEQFSLGGVNTVRGFRQDSLLSDGGILASAEIKLPLLRFAGDGDTLHFVPFVDIGTAWNVDSTQKLDSDTLVGVGVGLQLSLNDTLNARIDWGIPLTEGNNNSSDTLQENGVYFSLDYRI